jgi:hypothetical protein
MKHIPLLFIVAVLFVACNTESTVDPVVPQKAPAATGVGQAILGLDTPSPTDDRIDSRIRLELQQMTKILGLTERQQAAVLDLLKKKYAMQQQLMRQYQNNPIALRKALAQLDTRVDNAIVSLLTKEQILKWKRWKGGPIGR